MTVLALGAALALDVGFDTTARAQFFFPFFDNRPSTPPQPYVRRPRHSRGEAEEARPHLRRDRAVRSEEKRGKGGASRKGVESRKSETRKSAKSGKPGEAGKPVPAVAEAPPPAYEPQLLRLSEVMGALAYLQTVCDAPAGAASVKTASSEAASGDAAPWRDRMEALMTAEDAGPSRREKLAGAFNHGWQGYQYSYRICTPSAQLARSRFLEEGARLAHDISTRYRAN
jgi:uncharacterized protein (TIGR02301 family)